MPVPQDLDVHDIRTQLYEFPHNTHTFPLLITLGYAADTICRLSAMLRVLISTLWHAVDLGGAASLTARRTACREVWYILIKR
jgi:hypothetical protein